MNLSLRKSMVVLFLVNSILTFVNAQISPISNNFTIPAWYKPFANDKAAIYEANFDLNNAYNENHYFYFGKVDNWWNNVKMEIQKEGGVGTRGGMFMDWANLSLVGDWDNNGYGKEHIIFGFGSNDPTFITERMRLTSTGNLGIGTTSPAGKLTISDGGIGLTVFPGYLDGTINNAWTTLDMPGTQGLRVWDNFSVSNNVGIGTTSPNAALQFGNAINSRRIVLWEDGNNDHQFYGFGINGNTLRYQTSSTAADHVFFAGTGSNSSFELLRIKGNGNIGIGTPSPESQLNITSGNYITDLSDDNSYFKLGSSNAGHILMDYNKIQMKGNATTAANLLINPYGGNVGIGTTSPTDKLQVVGNIRISDNTIYFRAGSDVYHGLGWFGSGKLFAGLNLDGPALFGFSGGALGTTNGGEKIALRWNNFGTVGIGTTPVVDIALKVKGSFNVTNSSNQTVFHVSSGKQLVFVGTDAYAKFQASSNNTNSQIQQNNFSMWVSKGIVTEDLAIESPTGWSDFVFEKGYDLRSLEEVAAYITTHGHLPEMPSEAQVKAQGYSVHDINKKLLQKIEELTLYAIQQEAKAKAQATQLEAQQKQFNSLEQRIKQLEEKQ